MIFLFPRLWHKLGESRNPANGFCIVYMIHEVETNKNKIKNKRQDGEKEGRKKSKGKESNLFGTQKATPPRTIISFEAISTLNIAIEVHPNFLTPMVKRYLNRIFIGIPCCTKIPIKHGHA